ncbi:hypothetical protein ONS95_004316 [Cadophora gregata]|uniref:uncharacterized protein n=1 Tax=Cadophora gregata TaxID=51156 RepID=UPI0026DCA0A9|nr:uncharacterized protein ONS95_004316 [Cadophora gregata]KAK0105301.1 hypothetical protein ONS96_004697 [Cadophora gregata f. sp. sojae]KAK0105799.1 hypothetical protein ONS95_004316 [Cadophora gregata]
MEVSGICGSSPVNSIESSERDMSSEEKGITGTLCSENSSTPTLDLTNGVSANGSAEITVWWDEPEDQDMANPMNWSSSKKWVNICTISVISFIVPLVSSMLAPGVELITIEFNTTSKSFATFVVSIFVLGFAVGSLILPPLSELYGRTVVYHVTNILLLTFTIMCALSQNPGTLLVARFLSGFVGVATITIGSGTIADIMPRQKRGKAVSIWSVGTILGPMVGPVIGGYVAQTLGWRWVFWSISIVIGAVTILAFIVLRETYPPVLLERKATKLRKATGNPIYKSKLAAKLTKSEHFKTSIFRPLKLLTCFPIVTIMCTYVAVLYGTLYLLFATYSFVFKEEYGFSTSATGLVFLAGGVGTIVGLAYVGRLSDRALKKRTSAGKANTPEDRLSLLITIPGALTFPLGLFLYGWTAEKHLHWIVPQIGTGITGFGSILIFVSIQTYLIDAFEEYAASVIGANAVLRGTAGALIPLAGLTMYDGLGWGWGNSILGFAALTLAPLPWVLGIYGARVRSLRLIRVNL